MLTTAIIFTVLVAVWGRCGGIVGRTGARRQRAAER
jgi:hypothetical protein